MKQAEATVAADEAAVRQAENNLSYTEIRARSRAASDAIGRRSAR